MKTNGVKNAKGTLRGGLAVLALFLFQVLAGRLGGAAADQLSYRTIDPYGLFARLSVHHFVMMLAALAAIAALGKRLHVNFGFSRGDSKTGMRYFLIFAAAFAGIAVLYHALAYLSGRPPVYDFPLHAGNVAGTLGFQLLLSGPAEEILFRALPVTVLVRVFGKSVTVRGKVTLEVVLASFLFALAHVSWSLIPFAVHAQPFQLLYAFGLGIVQGTAYQESRSVLYPMMMHSAANILMVGTGYLFAALA